MKEAFTTPKYSLEAQFGLIEKRVGVSGHAVGEMCRYGEQIDIHVYVEIAEEFTSLNDGKIRLIT